MMSKRRIAWIIVALVVLAGAGAGLWWHIRRSTGLRLLSRAELAMRAGKADKALDLATSYAAKYPDDWRGHYFQAQAYLRQGKYEQARPPLAEAAKRQPGEVGIVLAEAQSYALPGLKRFAVGAKKAEAVRDAIAQVGKANEILAAYQPSGDSAALDVRQEIGLNQLRIAQMRQALASLLEAEAQVAAASRDADAAHRKREISRYEAAQAEKAIREVIQTLLEVVEKDATRERPAEALVELCLQTGDRESLLRGRKAIEALAAPPPVAAVLLAMEDLRSAPGTGPEGRRATLPAVAQRLESLQKTYPDHATVKLARAEVAMMSGDTQAAEKLAGEVVEAEAQNAQAQLLHGRALLAQGKKADAEKELFRLKARLPNWYLAQYWYAMAAQATGNVELASEAMRSVTRLRPDHPDALKHFARLLLDRGFYEQAFKDAHAYYQAHPNDSEALRLFVAAARATDQPDIAREALGKAWRPKDPGAAPTGPVALMVVAEGYLSLGNAAEAQQVLEDVLKLAQVAPPKTTEQALAVARAFSLRGRAPEAERLLSERLAASPNDARVCFALAGLYNQTGRGLQAQELYRRAVLLNDREPSYRLAFARALIDIGELGTAGDVLLSIRASNVEAELLLLQVKALRGEPIEAEAQAILRQPDAGRRFGLPLAMIYLANGQPDRCAEICQAKLQQTPEDVDICRVLAQAYLAMGQRDKSVETWKQVIKLRPDSLPAYERLIALRLPQLAMAQAATQPAGVMQISREQVHDLLEKMHEELRSVAPMEGMAHLAAAEQHTALGNHARAAELCELAIRDAGIGEAMVYRAALLRASALSRAGAMDEAMQGLDRLIAGTKGLARTRAMFSKAMILAGARRLGDAEAVLTQLCKEAQSDKDSLSLGQAAQMLGRIGKVDEALGACEAVQQMLPNDPRSYLLRADVLSLAGKRDEVPALYERAIELQPADIRLYTALAEIHNQQNQPLAALDVLGRLDKQGSGTIGQVIGLFQQGVLLASWGLQGQAVERFEKLAAIGQTASPALQLARARALAGLGRKDQAVAAIAKVSPYAPEYLASRLLEADLAETLDKKLAILQDLSQRKPGEEAVLVRQMQVLLAEGRPAEALKAFDAYRAARSSGGAFPVRAGELAVMAAVRAGQLKRASEIALAAHEAAPNPQRRLLAALLCLDEAPQAVAKLLPDPAREGILPAALGLCLAKRRGDDDAVKAWSECLTRLEEELARMREGQGMPAAQKLLIALILGDQDGAKAAAGKLETRDSGPAAQELVAHAAASPKAAEEAVRLMQIALARSLEQNDLARHWSMAVLESRPACQWAAAQVILTATDVADLQKAAALLTPKDCELARTLQAALLRKSGKPKEAAAIYADLAKAEDPVDRQCLLLAAMALEEAGLTEQALEQYRQVLQLGPDPVAANNAACLAVQLYPSDAPRLAEARAWAEQAMKAFSMPHTQDTLAWISHLQGRSAEALPLLRQAVRGLPESPDVHYHLGRVESAAGDLNLARWHLAAAVELGARLQAEGAPVPKTTAESVRLAKEALAEIQQPK